MAWNRMPVECLQLILDQLAEDNDIFSLNALLRVNKQLRDITLPYLYEDPFGLVAAKIGDDTDGISSIIKKIIHPLIRTLLSSANPLHLTLLLQNAYWENCADKDASFKNKSGINYLRYLRHFYPTSVNDSLFLNWKAFEENTLLFDYAEKNKLPAHYRDQDLLLEFNPYEDWRCWITRHLSVPMRVQLTWALCFPILEQIESLTIPLSDVDRYRDEMDRLKSLRRIIFKQDQKIDFSGFITGQLRREDPALLEKLRLKKAHVMEEMCEFVRDHTQYFPHVLLEADCPQDTTWVGAVQIAPQKYIDQLNTYTPSLVSPTILDATNWSQFIAKADITDLSLVHTVVPPRGEPTQTLEGLRRQCQRDNGISFLQRCRKLKKVDMVSLGPNTFSWAPQEKQQRQHYYTQHQPVPEDSLPDLTISSMSITSISPLSRSSLLQSEVTSIASLPPLLQPVEEVILRCYWDGLGTELDDLAVSFPETLTKLVIQGPRIQSAIFDNVNLSIPRALGETWHEPLLRLKKLAIFKLEETFRLSPLLLSRCPELQELRIEDKVATYNCDQILAYRVSQQYPTSLFPSEPGTSRLKSINLKGWSALCFHPETLRHTPLLESLCLMIESDRFMRNVIPDPGTLMSYDYSSLQEEADAIQKAKASISLSQLNHMDDSEQGSQIRPTNLRRPFWAWDWDLPYLTKLRLSGEFAYRFQFRMLTGCPLLEYLDLSIAVQGDHTPDITEEQLTGHRDYYYYTHKRVIAKSDFQKRASTHNEENKGKERDTRDAYLTSPCLKSLHLSGRWSMTDEFLMFLCTIVMPNLTDITESQCLTFTFAGWVRATSRLAHLKCAISGRKLPENELKAIGLVKFNQDYLTAPQYIAIEKIVDGEEQVTFVQVPNSDGIKHPRPDGIYSLNMAEKYRLATRL
ncbi:hypothetical protein FBU30_005166 [Linnemannia zychae]|nr:hypothetical protein FBU30_005166 [Linnemannia zychae]